MQSHLQLASGHKIPVIGLGTWQMEDETTVEQTIQRALSIGYKHFDTAATYNNEAFIGKALAASGKDHPRESLFLTSKVYGDKTHSYDSIMQSFQQSITNLQTDYLDCFLIHWPGVTVDGAEVTDADKLREYRKQAWSALEKLHREGKCKSIGVSNFYVQHLEPLLEHCSIVPHINQIEYHPLMFSDTQETANLCKEKNIVVEAFSPFAHGMIFDMGASVTSDKILQWAAHAHGEKVVLAKSTNTDRLKQNFDALNTPSTLTAEEIETLDQMYAGIHIIDDPTTVA
jgi:diketogulonate reductase-like aldo/keto reductase